MGCNCQNNVTNEQGKAVPKCPRCGGPLAQEHKYENGKLSITLICQTPNCGYKSS